MEHVPMSVPLRFRPLKMNQNHEPNHHLWRNYNLKAHRERKNVNTNSTSDFGDTPLHHAAPLHKAAQIGLTVEMVDNLSIPELKIYLQGVNFSISGKDAGAG